MTELEKLDAGLEYDFWDDEVDGRKQYAIEWCNRIHQIDQRDGAAIAKALTEFFGSAGELPWVGPGFSCDYRGDLESIVVAFLPLISCQRKLS